MTQDEMAGWHHWLDGRESEWTPGVGVRQGVLACCDSWGHKESDTTERLNWTEASFCGRLRNSVSWPSLEVCMCMCVSIVFFLKPCYSIYILEEGMVTHSRILPSESHGQRLLAVHRSQRVSHDWSNWAWIHSRYIPPEQYRCLKEKMPKRKNYEFLDRRK